MTSKYESQNQRSYDPWGFYCGYCGHDAGCYCACPTDKPEHRKVENNSPEAAANSVKDSEPEGENL